MLVQLYCDFVGKYVNILGYSFSKNTTFIETKLYHTQDATNTHGRMRANIDGIQMFELFG